MKEGVREDEGGRKGNVLHMGREEGKRFAHGTLSN